MTFAARWVEASELGAQGCYAQAWDILNSFAQASGAWPSLALSMRGSHLRQIGETVAARGCDSQARVLAVDAESRADALIGLAADGIAAGESSNAAILLDEAQHDAASDWRTATRWQWVSAELCLLRGDPSRALDHAERAAVVCRDRSERHLAKSRIMADAARGAAGQVDVGGDLLLAARVLRAHRWVTLQWPLALVATDLRDSGRASADLVAATEDLLAEGAAAVQSIAAGLPEGLRTRWRSGPAALRLLSGGE